ncbi:MAG: glycosyltransferase [Paracoccaceae bacterium]
MTAPKTTTDSAPAAFAPDTGPDTGLPDGQTLDIPWHETLRDRLRFRAGQARAARIRARAMARPFSPGARARLLLVSEPERIPQSQIAPFHTHAAAIARRTGTEIREADLRQLLAGAPCPATGATTVAFQTPYDISDADLAALFSRLEADHPGARLVCLDWFAPTDLRNAARMHPRVAFYVKKHLLRDRARYGAPTRGDTNLTDAFNRRFGLDEPEQRFAIPEGFLDKLILGPSFVTAPQIAPAFARRQPPEGPRPIDIHARFATAGTPWYQAMREEAEAAVARSPARVLTGDGVRMERFLAEMRRSKICFSPFGYGEVCWRDYEAVAMGAVLMKPDMSHVETDPDIFEPWQSYAPLAWDLGDFDAVVARLLGDPALRQRLARNAYGRLRDWLGSEAFVTTMMPLFA